MRWSLITAHWPLLISPLQRRFGFQIFNVAPDARDCTDFVTALKNHGSLPRVYVARYCRLIVAPTVTDVMNVDIEMVAPEKWRHNEPLLGAQNVARRGLTLSLSHHPMFD